MLREELGEHDSPALAAEVRNAIAPAWPCHRDSRSQRRAARRQLDRVTLADLLPAAGRPASGPFKRPLLASGRSGASTDESALPRSRSLSPAAHRHRPRAARGPRGDVVVIPIALLLAGAGGLWLASIGLRPITIMARRATSIPLTGIGGSRPASSRRRARTARLARSTASSRGCARRCRRSGSSWRTPRTSCEARSPSSERPLT